MFIAERQVSRCGASNPVTGAECMHIEHGGYTSHMPGDPCEHYTKGKALIKAGDELRALVQYTEDEAYKAGRKDEAHAIAQDLRTWDTAKKGKA
jgi:hypothetical protein